MKDDRVPQMDPGGYVSRSRTCSASGCGSITRECKPYCPKHVRMMPYASVLIAERESREAEISSIMQGKAVEEGSVLLGEMLEHLKQHGERTVARIARDKMIDIYVIWKLLRVLQRRGLVRVRKSTRGNYIASLK